jgi:hypothetical protein
MKLRISAAGVSFVVSLRETPRVWTEGDALALPYGRTPISTDERPKLASRCNVLGRLEGDPISVTRA